MRDEDAAFERTITSESEFSDFGGFLRTSVKNVLTSGDISIALFLREFNSQYRASFLGYFWALVPALLFAGGFIVLSHTRLVDFGDTGVPYPAFAIVSMLLWHTFQDAVQGPLNAMTTARPMLGRLPIPAEAVIISSVLRSLLLFLPKLVLSIPVCLAFGVELTAGAVAALLPLISMFIFATALGSLLAPLALLIEDLAKALGIVFMFWMLLTPVAYAPPASTAGWATLMGWNPPASLLSTTRELFLGLPVTYGTEFWVVTALGIVALPVALLLMRLAIPYIVERAGS